MWNDLRHLLSGCLIVTLTVFSLSPITLHATEQPMRELAVQIVETAGVPGGLLVHVGCDEGRLTAQLRVDERFLVQGLDEDARKVAAAREHLLASGSYGPVSIDRFDGQSLPYTENAVNLLVVDAKVTVAESEVQRVLCPGGVAVMLTPELTVADTRQKPWPEEIDQWTHFLHDASNNAVAQDSVVGPPRRLKWLGGPLWSRSHEFHSSLSSMVAAGGRLFYIFDEGLTSITDPPIPEQWTLVARDAFNGVPLWKQPMTRWGAEPWGNRALRSVPPSAPRLLVADEARVYLPLSYGGPISALDAASGRPIATYAETDGAEELRCTDGVLLVRVGRDRLLALEAATGRLLWQRSAQIQPAAWAAQEGRVFCQDNESAVCLDLKTGERLWQTPGSPPAVMLVVHGGRVLLGGRRDFRALSAGSGDVLWTAKGGLQRQEMFAAQGRLWYWQGDSIVGRDLETGQDVTRLDTDDVFTPGHHLRCYQTKATEQYLVTPNRGVEFVSLTDEPNTQCDWTRGACRYGVMPCNGLLYVPPNPCFCYPGVKVPGFLAFAPARSTNEEGIRTKDEGMSTKDEGISTKDEQMRTEEEGRGAQEQLTDSDRLERGPAYDDPTLRTSSLPLRTSSAWPTYRHDARRSGATDDQVGAQVSESWEVRLSGRLTPPVAGGDRVLVAARDTHTVYALSSEDGHELWHYTAGGRIDSPPTLHAGLVLFGSADGWAYCLRLTDGQLVWRFRAAPRDERIVAFGQLESPWRVHGSVLIEDGVAYFTAGRSSFLDGGIRVFAVDPVTGKLLHQTRVDTWTRTREDAEGKPFVPAYHMEGARSDILVGQHGFLYLGQLKFNRQLVRQDVPYVLAEAGERPVAMDLSDQPFAQPDQDPNGRYEQRQRDWIERTQKDLVAGLREEFGSYNLGDRELGLHVFSTSGFLDDSWFNRTYWMYAKTWPGFYIAHRAPKTGQLLVVGPQRTYAMQAFPTRNFQSPLFTPGQQGYLLQADENDNEPILDYRTRGTTKGWGFSRAAPPVWHDWVPIRIRGMVLAGDHLFVAGPPDAVDPDDPLAAFDGRRGAVLRTYDAEAGQTLAEHTLDSPPVFDGLIAASGRLYLATTDDRLVCLESR